MKRFKKLRHVLQSSPFVVIVVSILLGAILAACVIYTTPLKWLTFGEPQMNQIDPAVFWKEYQEDPGHYVFLDVRLASQYQTAHAQGALSEPIVNLFEDHSILPKSGKEIAVMCNDGHLSAIAYGYLHYEGFTNVVNIEGGLDQWNAEGLPVVGNASAIPKPS